MENLDQYDKELWCERNGVSVYKMVIPLEEKQGVIDRLSPFVPGKVVFDMQYRDLHTGKTFMGNETVVVYEGEDYWVVTPFYIEGGGTLIDMMPVDKEAKAT